MVAAFEIALRVSADVRMFSGNAAFKMRAIFAFGKSSPDASSDMPFLKIKMQVCYH